MAINYNDPKWTPEQIAIAKKIEASRAKTATVAKSSDGTYRSTGSAAMEPVVEYKGTSGPSIYLTPQQAALAASKGITGIPGTTPTISAAGRTLSAPVSTAQASTTAAPTMSAYTPPPLPSLLRQPMQTYDPIAPVDQTPYNNFNTQLMALLAKAQSVTSAPQMAQQEKLVNQSLNLSNPLNASPYQELFQGMTPGASLAAQGGTQAAFNPGIGSLEHQIALNNQGVQNATSLIGSAGQFASDARTAALQARAQAIQEQQAQMDQEYRARQLALDQWNAQNQTGYNVWDAQQQNALARQKMQMEQDQLAYERAQIPTAVIQGANGHSLLINTQTGQLLKDYGASSAPSAGGAGGLTPAQLQNTLNAINDDFRQDPAVKQYTQSSAGWSTLANIDTNTNNPADDIAAIYAFAKIMDPESVVREGEYATIQKYAQSWAQSFGFDVARIFTNSKFLSSGALSNMKYAAGAKQQAQENAYNAARQNYQSRIDAAQSGQISMTLPSYGYAPASTQSQQSGTSLPPGVQGPVRPQSSGSLNTSNLNDPLGIL